MSSTSRQRVRDRDEKKTFHFFCPYRVCECVICRSFLLLLLLLVVHDTVSKCHLFIPMRRIYVFPDANSHFIAEKKYFFLLLYGLLYVSINNRLQWKKDSTRLRNVQMNKVQSIIWIYIRMYLYAFWLLSVAKIVQYIFLFSFSLCLADNNPCAPEPTGKMRTTNGWGQITNIANAD